METEVWKFGEMRKVVPTSVSVTGILSALDCELLKLTQKTRIQ